ncbi:hypothetical protein ACJIZ3_023298 [Penstemon smallii]|uniref:Uncharacterized protein n=1 Tax=Penstemon smallii TaxID=265156 RepID=A0ABD3TPM1_9LAMI
MYEKIEKVLFFVRKTNPQDSSVCLSEHDMVYFQIEGGLWIMLWLIGTKDLLTSPLFLKREGKIRLFH